VLTAQIWWLIHFWNSKVPRYGVRLCAGNPAFMRKVVSEVSSETSCCSRAERDNFDTSNPLVSSFRIAWLLTSVHPTIVGWFQLLLSLLSLSIRIAFAVSFVFMRNTTMTILYRQLAIATLWLPLVYGVPLPLPLCVSKRDSHVMWDIQIITLRKCL